MVSSVMASLRSLLFSNPIAAAVSDTYSSFSDRRAKLGLSNPGAMDTLDEEVTRDVFVSNTMFHGLRAEMGKTMSLSPLFRVAHSFTMVEGMGPYNLTTMFGTNNEFLQGSIESSGDVIARCNYRLSQRIISKANIQLSNGQSAASLENDYRGDDFSLALKTVTPSILSGGLTGIYVGQYLQAVTPKLSIGLEALWQRQSRSTGPEAMVSYCARYKSTDWIATGQILAAGALTASYWRRLSDKVQAGARMELSMSQAGLFSGGGIKKEGNTTVGVRYDFRMSTLRVQLDSKGKLGCLLEKRMDVPVVFTFATDIDYFTQQAKVGIGFQFEANSEEIEERMIAGTAQQANPPL